jgi:hypothetical protein
MSPGRIFENKGAAATPIGAVAGLIARKTRRPAAPGLSLPVLKDERPDRPKCALVVIYLDLQQFYVDDSRATSCRVGTGRALLGPNLGPKESAGPKPDARGCTSRATRCSDEAAKFYSIPISDLSKQSQIRPQALALGCVVTLFAELNPKQPRDLSCIAQRTLRK